MRVHIYEEREESLKILCDRWNISPTKLVNEMITYLEEVCQEDKAKDVYRDEVFRRFRG